MELVARFEQSLSSHELVAREDRILIAVSGGLDSVVLLHLFVQAAAHLKLNLQVVHVHHGIRTEDADLDSDFVRSLAQKNELPFILKKVDARSLALKKGLSLEEAARTVRYHAFEEALRDTDFRRLATAHTANDQAETILDRLLRGSGIRGMGGMLVRRDFYIRPVLAFTRDELEQYAVANKLDFREDITNRDPRFKRNRIRNQLIPLLEKDYNPSVVSTVNRFASIFQEAEQFLSFYAETAFKSLVFLDKKNEIILDLEGFINYFDIVKKYIIFHACDVLAVDRSSLQFEKIERILQVIRRRNVGKRVSLNDDFELLVDHDGIVFREKSPDHEAKVLDLNLDKSAIFNCYEIRWSIIDKPARLTFDRSSRVEYVDLEATGSDLRLRNVRAGDRFIPLNFNGHKKVAAFFSDRKIPHHLRSVLPILESSKGIVWLCGYCIDNRFKVTDKTNRLLKLELIDRNDGY